ncbi:unnamed protein product [Nippostrongylus brasiliensis]|uniref:Kelch repeat protein n=1 Tax=Nippostrongylus brasiliensis TaxID=27835 RepID=A0A0N4YIJ1_NIPBR|nr:unnamed protein product [Nippostrongylus brasiliensis]
MASVVLLIGGCTEREEGGALRSIEELSFRHTAAGMNVGSRIVGDLLVARRSPSDCRGVLLGGFNGNDCLKEVQLVELNGSEVAARRLPDIPFRLKNSVAVKLPDSSVLLFGGWDESQTMRTVFRLAFDEAITSYDMKMEAVLPYAIEGHSCALHNDHIFVIGGYDGISVVDSIVILDRYVVVMAGWNGREALDSIELFEIVDESPYLIPVIVDCKLSQARIRPVSIASH